MWRRHSGTVLHALGGAAITAAGVLVGVPGWLLLATVAIGGWLREVVQHDLRLTVHQWIEAASWGAGSAVAWCVVWALT